jgi:hypothetical protein
MDWAVHALCWARSALGIFLSGYGLDRTLRALHSVFWALSWPGLFFAWAEIVLVMGWSGHLQGLS